jgi:sugar phosphate isomerase/epimerase
MSATELKDFSRLCVHTITTKPWSVEQAMEKYEAAGVKGISVWRDTLEGKKIVRIGERIRAHDLKIVSLVRGGFFAAADRPARQKAIEENLRCIEEAAQLGSPLIVLVCGAAVGQSLEVSRNQIRSGIEAILPAAAGAGIKLAIEPLQPMYADTRSAINTLKQANDLAIGFDSPYLGVAVDVYHVWWDPDLESEIKRCAAHHFLFAFHICDWLTPTKDMLNDRGLMGEGCIPVKKIRGWVETAGFIGFNEVEIFSNRFWAADQDVFLEKIKRAYLQYA